jgi:hypothetical protein
VGVVAQLLSISEHTLQDHLKAIFAKTNTDSRRLLSARAAGASPEARRSRRARHPVRWHAGRHGCG